MKVKYRKFIKQCIAISCILLFTACDDSSEGDGSVSRDEFEVFVDTSLSLPVDMLPGLDDKERPLSVLESENGEQATFVANELWFASDDRAEVDALLNRWDGVILQEVDMREAGIDSPVQYLIRIDTTLADTSSFPANIRVLEPEGGEQVTASSQQGLELISASVEERIGGRNAGINWIVQSNELELGFTTEAPVGDSLGNGILYTPNSAQWPTHSIGSTQNIGVVSAWEALARADKLSNKVGIAILDMGFSVNEDLSTDYEAISVVPSRSALDSRNLFDCSGGNPCPWHGTLVTSAAMAVPDNNNFGSAGPGGPIAKPVLVLTTGDMFMSVVAIAAAKTKGVKIINMSYSVPVPWYLVASLLPFEGVTLATRNAGTLIFAAAGNSDTNVDADKTLFGRSLGFEKTWHAPCENAGVICVGGIATDSLRKANLSNYGAEQVDIFAPFSLWLGPDPDSPDNAARRTDGTSFSAPFTAGVAGLVWSANPQLSAAEVEAILMETAHDSSDSKVNRIVNAAGAVQSALGNVAPNLDVRSPRPDQELQVNLAYTFLAEVNDFEDGRNCCLIGWLSDIDGDLGDGQAIDVVFDTLGARTIEVSTSDSQGAQVISSIPIVVVNSSPTVKITSPTAGATIFQNVPFQLRGSADDINEPDRLLACNRLDWASSSVEDTDFPLNGCETTVTFSSLGSRTITLSGEDPNGGNHSAAVNVTVVEPPENLPPAATIISPANRQAVGKDEQITLSVSADDPENDPNLTIVWTMQLNSAAPIEIGQGAESLWKPSDSIDFINEGQYEVTISVRVTDSAGNTGTDLVTLREWNVIN